MTEQERARLNGIRKDVERFKREYGSKYTEDMDFIFSVIDQQDKTIAELREVYDMQYGAMIQHLKRENEWLREYVEQLKHERDMLAEQLGMPQSLEQGAEGSE